MRRPELVVSSLVMIALAFAGAWPAGAAGQARVLAEDRQEILDLISSYSRTYDARDTDEFVKLFVADSEWEVYGSGAATPAVRFAGREQLRAGVAARLKELQQKGVQTRHYQTNTVLTSLADGVVSGTTMVQIVWQTPNERPGIVTTGLYVDVFVRDEGRWRIAKRALYMDQAAISK